MNIAWGIIARRGSRSAGLFGWALWMMLGLGSAGVEGQTPTPVTAGVRLTRSLSAAQLSPDDSLQSEDFMLEGVKEKILGNKTLAKEYFNQSIQSDPRNDASLYELAQLSLEKGENVEAKRLLNRALAIKPKESYFLLAMLEANTALRDSAAMLLNFSSLIAGDPLRFDYYVASAEVLIARGKLVEAIALYDQFESQSGQVEAPEFQKQKIYLTHHQSGKALESMKSLVARFPSNARYHLLIAEIYRSMGEEALAWTSLVRAHDLAPSNGFIQLGLFEYHAGKGEYAKADSFLVAAFKSGEISTQQKISILEDYFLNKNLGAPGLGLQLTDQLWADFPDDARLRTLHQQLNRKAVQGQTHTRQALSAYILTQPGDYSTFSELIKLDLEANDGSIAVRHCMAALELYPNQIALYRNLAEAYTRLGQNAQAEKTLKKGLQVAMGTGRAEASLWEELGDLWSAQKMEQRADSAYQTALKCFPDPVLYNNFAFRLALRNTHLALADSMAKRAIVLSPGQANVEDTYAWILFLEGKSVLARHWIEEALAHDQASNPVLWDHAGDIAYALKDWRHAVEYWKKSLRLGSNNVLLPDKIRLKHP